MVELDGRRCSQIFTVGLQSIYPAVRQYMQSVTNHLIYSIPMQSVSVTLMLAYRMISLSTLSSRELANLFGLKEDSNLQLKSSSAIRKVETAAPTNMSLIR